MFFGSLSGYLAYMSYCSYDNPMKIDFGSFWQSEVPVPQLLVSPQVSDFRHLILLCI
jgi:hypothetical protein